MFLILQYAALSTLQILGRIKGQNSALVTQTDSTSTVLVKISHHPKILQMYNSHAWCLKISNFTYFAVKSGMPWTVETNLHISERYHGLFLRHLQSFVEVVFHFWLS